jgi:hypothetical protein
MCLHTLHTLLLCAYADVSCNVSKLLSLAMRLHSCLQQQSYTAVLCNVSTQLKPGIYICLRPCAKQMSLVYKALSCHASIQLFPVTCLHRYLMPRAHTTVSCHMPTQLSRAMCLHRWILPCAYTAVSCNVSRKLSPTICLNSSFRPHAYTVNPC